MPDAPKYATGGIIPDYKGTDDVPIRRSPGFIIPAHVARRVGLAALDRLNGKDGGRTDA